MRKNIYILTVFVIGFGLLAASCTDFIDVNKDPNYAGEVTPKFVLPAALDNTAAYVSGGTGSLNHLGSMMMFNYSQSYGFDWYPRYLAYNFKGGFLSGLFGNAYLGALQQYDRLGDLTDDKYGFYKAIGFIMQAYHYQILVDLYGKIPYTESMNRADESTPAYDEGQAIYDSLIDKLTKAIELINADVYYVSVGAEDAIYGGNMAKWAAFANSIKIRILTRENGVQSKTYINKQLQKIKANGYGYIQKNVIVDPGYKEGQPGKQNPYWATFGVDASGSVSSTHDATCATLFVVNWFQQTQDPRFTRIFEVPADGALGINQGAIDPFDDHSAQQPAGVANLKLGGGILIGGDQGTVIMTEAELQLNLAELALKGFNVTGTAKEHYRHAVVSSFLYLGLTQAAADAYLSQNLMSINWQSSPNKMNAIMTQKWLATFGLTAAQSWFDYSRTGLPNVTVTKNLAKKNARMGDGWPISYNGQTPTGERPVRLTYPNSEYSYNAQNVPDADEIDAFTDKIFWAE